MHSWFTTCPRSIPALLLVCSLLTAVDAGAARRTPLRRLALARGIHVGTAVADAPLTGDATYRSVLRREYSVVTPENAMKWGPIHPERDRYDFAAADRLIAAARAARQRIRGHNLVWYMQNPAWLTDGDLTRDQAIAVLRDHIHTVVGRYRGKIAQWDVVNEAFNDLDGTLRNTIWLQRIGVEYLELAFRFAHEADPRAKLYYNDFLSESSPPKFEAILALVTELKARGVPIDGVGFQAHAFYGVGCTGCVTTLAEQMARVAAAGFDVAITELDAGLPQPTTPALLEQQAQFYGDVVAACRAVRRCRTIVTWGFTDKYSWIPSFMPGRDDALPFDRMYEPKPAYFAIRRALTAPRR